MKEILFVSAVLMALVSCRKQTEAFTLYDIRFAEVQPQGAKSLDRFPKRFRGTYTGPDSTALIVTRNGIFTKRPFRYTIHRAVLDTASAEVRRIGDKLIFPETNDTADVHFAGDSARISFVRRDTVFLLSPSARLTRMGDRLVTNKMTDGLWRITLLQLDRKKWLTVIQPGDHDLARFDSISKAVSSDSTGCVFRPRRNEFRKMIKPETFGIRQTFKKKRNEKE